MDELAAHMASLRDSLFATLGSLVGQPDLADAAGRLHLRAQDLAHRLLEPATPQLPPTEIRRLVGRLSDAAARVSGSLPSDRPGTARALRVAGSAMDEVAHAIGLQVF